MIAAVNRDAVELPIAGSGTAAAIHNKAKAEAA